MELDESFLLEKQKGAGRRNSATAKQEIISQAEIGQYPIARVIAPVIAPEWAGELY